MSRIYGSTKVDLFPVHMTILGFIAAGTGAGLAFVGPIAGLVGAVAFAVVTVAMIAHSSGHDVMMDAQPLSLQADVDVQPTMAVVHENAIPVSDVRPLPMNPVVEAAAKTDDIVTTSWSTKGRRELANDDTGFERSPFDRVVETKGERPSA